MAIIHEVYCAVFICCTTVLTCCHSLPFVVTLCNSFSLFVTCCTTCCHSLYHLLSFLATRCTTRYHSLSFVVTRCTTCCHSLYHSLSFVVTRCHSMYRLVCLFINDRNILLLLISYFKSKVYSFLSTLAINAIK